MLQKAQGEVFSWDPLELENILGLSLWEVDPNLEHLDEMSVPQDERLSNRQIDGLSRRIFPYKNMDVIGLSYLRIHASNIKSLREEYKGDPRGFNLCCIGNVEKE